MQADTSPAIAAVDTTPGYVVDFSNVEERDFSPIPRGRYVVEITNAEIREGNEFPYLMVESTVASGDFADKKLWDNMSFSPKALWKLKQFYRGLSVSDEDLSTGFTVDPDELIGQTVLVNVQVKPDQQGEPRNVVSRYMSLLEEEPA